VCPVDQSFEPELVDVSSFLAQQLLERVHRFDGPRAGVAEDEAVAHPGGAAEHGLGAAAEPDRDRPGRLREDAGPLDVVEGAVDRDDGLVPEAAQHLDLLLEPAGAGGERRAERLVLDPVPPRAHPDAQPAAGQEGDLGGLLGDEGGLALGQDEHADDELEALGHRREVAEEHERLVEGVVLGVWAPERRLAVRVLGAEDVVVRDELIEAELLDAHREVADGARIDADVARGEHRAVLHAAGH
jgi:hypothetical protein